MSVMYLSIEILFDLLSVLIGGVLIIQSRDNFPKRYWGLIAVCIGLVFLWENIGWLQIISISPAYRFTDLLHLEKMLKWYLPASIVALFPVASLRPGYLTPFKVLSFLQVPILITTVGLCYMLFDGTSTMLTDWSQLSLHVGKADVQLRIGVFLLSVLTPIFSVLYPFFFYHPGRRANRNMYLFISFMFLFLCIYITFTLSINQFVFNLFGGTAVVFVLSFSFAYLRQENPFSDQETHCIASASVKPLPEVSVVQPLFYPIEEHLAADHSFVDPAYDLKDLAQTLGVKQAEVSAALKSGGFSSFREYLCECRLDYFKQLADIYPDKKVSKSLCLLPVLRLNPPSIAIL